MIYGRMQKSSAKDIEEGKINSQEYVDFQVGGDNQEGHHGGWVSKDMEEFKGERTF